MRRHTGLLSDQTFSRTGTLAPLKMQHFRTSRGGETREACQAQPWVTLEIVRALPGRAVPISRAVSVLVVHEMLRSCARVVPGFSQASPH